MYTEHYDRLPWPLKIVAIVLYAALICVFIIAVSFLTVTGYALLVKLGDTLMPWLREWYNLVTGPWFA